MLRRHSPGAAWLGATNLIDVNGNITNLVPWGSPLFEAGLDQGDIVLDVGGKAIAAGVLQAALKARKPGEQLQLSFKRRGGATGTATITLKEDPSVEVVAVESTGAVLSADQKAFRDSWLGSKAK